MTDYTQRIDKLLNKYRNEMYIYIHNERNDEEKHIIEEYLDNNIIKSNLSERIDRITNLIYTQEWTKLKIDYKKYKIKEYIEELKIHNGEKLIIELNNLLKSNKLNKKYINYDKINGKIINILCIIKKDDKYSVKI